LLTKLETFRQDFTGARSSKSGATFTHQVPLVASVNLFTAILNIHDFFIFSVNIFSGGAFEFVTGGDTTRKPEKNN
jgi:hypothetical protein